MLAEIVQSSFTGQIKIFCQVAILNPISPFVQVAFSGDNFREFATRNTVNEEIFKLHISIESRQEYFQKGTHL